MIQHHGFSPTDVGVYIFLITKKWFSTQTKFSAYNIVTSLNSLPNFLPKRYKIKYTEKTVSASIKKLELLGFVQKCDNDERSNGVGPAKAFFETTKIIDLQKSIQAQLDNHREKALDTISRLADIEESLDLKASGSQGDKDGKRR